MCVSSAAYRGALSSMAEKACNSLEVKMVSSMVDNCSLDMKRRSFCSRTARQRMRKSMMRPPLRAYCVRNHAQMTSRRWLTAAPRVMPVRVASRNLSRTSRCIPVVKS